MSAAALRRLGLGNGWVPERWHLKLADALARDMEEGKAAAAVYGIFGTAVLRSGCEVLGEDRFGLVLHLIDAIKRRKAEPYLPLISQLMAAPVRLVNIAPKAFEKDVEFERQCRARIDRLKVKSFNRGVEL